MLTGVEWLAPHLAHYTSAWVFGLLFASSFGLPLPEEVTLVAAGLVVHEGLVPFPRMLVVGLVGVLAGDIVVYGLGRRYGDGILRHRVLAEWLTPDLLVRIGDLERRYGSAALVAARLLPGLKTAAMLAAGVLGTPVRKFVLADLTGALASVSAALGLGYLFADRLEAAVSAVNRLEVVAAGLVVIMLLALGVRWYVARRLDAGARSAGGKPPGGPRATEGGYTGPWSEPPGR